jgi:hypothetical protein
VYDYQQRSVAAVSLQGCWNVNYEAEGKAAALQSKHIVALVK